MKRYRYRALDGEGHSRDGVLETADERQALEELARRGLIPLALDAERAAPVAKTALPWRRTRPALDDADRTQFLQETATLLLAGVPLSEVIPSLEQAYRGSALGEPLDHMLRQIRSGASLAVACEQAGLELPGHALAMIRAGEAAGRLGEALRDAAAQLEYERVTRQDFRNAMIYPAVLVASGITAVLIIFLAVVPRFASLLDSSRAEIPLISRWVIGAGLAFKTHWLESLLVLGVCAVLATGLLRRREIRQRLLDGLAGTPVVGRWIRDTETGRWATLMGHLLTHRVPLLDALRISSGALRLSRDRLHIQQALNAVRQGKALSLVLASQGWIAPTRLNLLRVGERAGELPSMMAELGRLHTEAARQSMKRVLALVEPAAILFIGAAIGFIMIAVMLAITSLNAGGG